MRDNTKTRLDLHNDLKQFYETGSEYFAEAHEVNSELTPERAHLLSWIKPRARVLDVGCGPGDNGGHVGQDVQYIGCDLSSTALKMAQRALPASLFCSGESQLLPFANGVFDVVLSTYALEHFVFPRESLEEMWRVCGRGGLVLLISPAYDDPRDLPPSTTHWTAFSRFALRVQQFSRQVARHVSPRRFYFAYVSRPRVLSDAYESDFDAVHLVSAREIANFFRWKGGVVLFERRRTARPVVEGTFLKRVFEHSRNLLLRLHIGEYAGLNLQIVVTKPE